MTSSRRWADRPDRDAPLAETLQAVATGGGRCRRGSNLVPYVEADQQAQDQGQEEGQPRQAAQRRPRLIRPTLRQPEHLAARTLGQGRQALSVSSSRPTRAVGRSEMIPSTSRSSSRAISPSSLMVHTWTARPRSWAVVTN